MPTEAKQQKTVIIASGASGGHVFPALSVADELCEKGFNCVFVGNGGKFLKMVEEQGYKVIVLPASPFNVRNPVRKLKAIFNLVRALGRAFRIIHNEKASVVFGTGGYATVAAVLAAKVSGVPTIVQEQNVLPGRANRFLSKWVDRVCLSFEASRHYLKYREGVMVVTGNPVRKRIIKSVNRVRSEDGKFNILIMGGSQGAKILSDIVPEAINLLPYELQKNVNIIQQTRPEDVQRVKNAYHDLDIPAEVTDFFENMEEKIIQSHLVIARSGASTVNETALLGRAAIYVPLRLADGHQIQNARVMEQAGAALLMEQADFTPEKVSEAMADLMQDKKRLAKMEFNARQTAVLDAAERVANEVVKLSRDDIMAYAEQLNDIKK